MIPKCPSATVRRGVVVQLGDTMRRWRLALAVLALVGATGTAIVGAHAAIDAAVVDATHEHADADACMVVGLVCAVALAGVACRRAVRPQRLRRVASDRVPDAAPVVAWAIVAARALEPPRRAARLCRFQT
jgi:hypothetical protein